MGNPEKRSSRESKKPNLASIRNLTASAALLVALGLKASSPAFAQGNGDYEVNLAILCGNGSYVIQFNVSNYQNLPQYEGYQLALLNSASNELRYERIFPHEFQGVVEIQDSSLRPNRQISYQLQAYTQALSNMESELTAISDIGTVTPPICPRQPIFPPRDS